MDSGEQEDTPNPIAECVQTYWNQHRRPMLLSALGTAVDEQTTHESQKRRWQSGELHPNTPKR